MIELNKIKVPTYNSEEAIEYLKRYLNKISERYSKNYKEDSSTEEDYL